MSNFETPTPLTLQLTKRQILLIAAALSYSSSNIDDLNDALEIDDSPIPEFVDEDFTLLRKEFYAVTNNYAFSE